MHKKMTLLPVALSLIIVLGCNKKSDDAASTTSSTDVTNAVGLIQTGIGVVGSGMSGSTVMSLDQYYPMAVTQLTSSLCDSHGSPLQSNGSSLSQSAATYPFVHTYCAMTISDGETVKGGFSLVKSLICVLEKGGIQFAGATQSITANFNDTQCWPSGGPGGETGTITISATGSSPASFNSHFDKGVIFTVDSYGLEFKIAANLTSDKIEFIAYENWNGANAGNSTGNQSVMAGELNKTTGVLRFEKRDERIRSTCTTSSCGWNRHTRLYAQLGLTNGEPSSLTSLSYGYSDVQANASTLSGSTNNGYGKVITAKGSLSSGLKARLFQTSPGISYSNLQSTGSYSETSNTACATSSGVNDAATCASESGIANFSSNTKFTLVTGASPTHTSPATWLSSFTGFNYSTVSLDTDNAF